MTERLNPESYAIPSIAELDQMRVEHGLSQKELSRRADMEPDRFNTILNRDMDPQTSTTRAFLKVLQETDGQTEEDLASKRGPKPKPSTLTGKLEAADPDDLLTDGGRKKCVECGSFLPDEIEPGTGVYCPECGTGQHLVTDGGAVGGGVPQLRLTDQGLEAPDHVVGRTGIVRVEKPHLTMEIDFVEPVREVERELTVFPTTGEDKRGFSVPEGHIRIDGREFEIVDDRDLNKCPHCGSDKISACDDPPRCFGCDTYLERGSP